ncbi:anaerobic benzoate catabolism transcriptional regulator [Poriferisphaera corsica]|uniref:Anaerobic benzoate catabolism transcriptional regulator n=1 Tax=Poriferisphaera corsica TaxID=2528020 RepID=A0A517YW99_9BACT|nr:XRE family transcriptional regulator [Poriferisphaera corsica]QDU34487.1 anaerobic benzoate catabolism transcriptional regulator [Poriferisphaera corsica]
MTNNPNQSQGNTPQDPTPSVSHDRHDGSDPVTKAVCDKVRELRKKQRWTLQQLADASGVSRSMLSQIERGQANPTLGVAYRIAQAFNLPLGHLVDAAMTESHIEIIRGDDPTFIYKSDDTMQVRTLSPLNKEKDVEFYELRLEPGTQMRSASHFEGTTEFLTVLKGQGSVHSGDDVCVLKKGDSAHYRADVPHMIENSGKTQLYAFLVTTYRA